MLNIGENFSADGRQYTILDLIGRGANTIAYLAECRDGELNFTCILKEYAPHNQKFSETGKFAFMDSGKKQNAIRQKAFLKNQTPPVSHIFQANGTAYIDVACYQGKTLNQLNSLTLPQYMAICETIARTVNHYHEAGFLCLDVKPENIFILQNTPEETITQLVEFIDFDSVHGLEHSQEENFSYTPEWSAPEQRNPYAVKKISFATDIYTLGEMIFYFIFGRHSKESEHRGFSTYAFDECAEKNSNYLSRPDIQAIFTKLFHGTIRSSPVNRFRNMQEVIKLLSQLVEELNRKEYILPLMPAVSPNFIGRESELKQIAQKLNKPSVLFVTGVGGIGKTTLLKNYIHQYYSSYEMIVYLEYDGDFERTFCDDHQLAISTISRQPEETLHEYFSRKFSAFRRICRSKRVLFVLDNFNDRLTKTVSRMFDYGYFVLIASRNAPPKQHFSVLELGAMEHSDELLNLISLNLERPMTKEEKMYFEKMITLVQGHTLMLELIAKQIAVAGVSLQKAFALIQENGFSHFSSEKISNYKDGEELYDTLSAIISGLFNASAVNRSEQLTLKILSLLNVRGLETTLVQKFFPEIQENVITELSRKGWIYTDNRRIWLHPVITEAVRNWAWEKEIVSVMDNHQKMIDIYAGMANAGQIQEILRCAKRLQEENPRHIVTGMYQNMLGCYYDVLSEGKYIPYTEKEAEILENMFHAQVQAIAEMQQSSDPRKINYFIQYNLSMASICIRSVPEYQEEAAEFLAEAYALMQNAELEISDNHCYYFMVSAWYATLVEPDFAETVALIQQAETIAKQVFPTELEWIDIIYIPAANCFYYHEAFEQAAEKIQEAMQLCRKYPESLPYIDKYIELQLILLDIYSALQDKPTCRKLIAEIDRLNETYRKQGIFREIPPEVRKQFQ